MTLSTAIFKVNSAAGGGGGLFGSLFSSIFGGGGGKFPSAPAAFYSDGGYTGDGASTSSWCRSQRSSTCLTKRLVKAAGGPAAMEAMRRNLKGYANGVCGRGLGAELAIAETPQTAGVVVNFNPVVDNRGASSKLLHGKKRH